MYQTFNGEGDFFGGDKPLPLEEAKCRVREFLKEANETVVSEDETSITTSYGEKFTFAKCG